MRHFVEGFAEVKVEKADVNGFLLFKLFYKCYQRRLGTAVSKTELGINDGVAVLPISCA